MEGLQSVITNISQLLNYLNPFHEDFFVYKLIELLGELLKELFVPSEERITALTDTVSSKFAFVDTIKIAINSLKELLINSGQAPTLSIELNSTKYTQAGTFKILDLSWYAPFKNFGDLILTGFIYITYLWRLFTKLPGIISGTSAGVESIRETTFKGGN